MRSQQVTQQKTQDLFALKFAAGGALEEGRCGRGGREFVKTAPALFAMHEGPPGLPRRGKRRAKDRSGPQS